MVCAFVSGEGAAFREKTSEVVTCNGGFGRDVFPSRTGSPGSVLSAVVRAVAGARDFAFATVQALLSHPIQLHRKGPKRATEVLA